MRGEINCDLMDYTKMMAKGFWMDIIRILIDSDDMDDHNKLLAIKTIVSEDKKRTD